MSTSLLDLPRAWLLELCSHHDIGCLWQTCHALLEARLHNGSRPELRIESDSDRAAAALCLAMRHASQPMHLVLVGCSREALTQIFQQTMLMMGIGFMPDHLSDVTLEDTVVDSLMPSQLVSACPGLTCLTLRRCTVQPATHPAATHPPASHPPVPPALRSLQLQGINMALPVHMPPQPPVTVGQPQIDLAAVSLSPTATMTVSAHQPDSIAAPALHAPPVTALPVAAPASPPTNPVTALQQMLAGLTSFGFSSSLGFSSMGWGSSKYLMQAIYACVCALPRTLLQLNMSPHSNDSRTDAAITAQILGGGYTALTHLNLNVVMFNEDLHKVLQLPALRHLTLDSFYLAEDERQTPCHLHTITCQGVSVQTLARLPLHSLTSPLTVTGGGVGARPFLLDPELAMLHDAVANTWGPGVRWKAAYGLELGWVHGVAADRSERAMLFLTAPPLLGQYEGSLDLSGAHVTADVLHVLHEQLVGGHAHVPILAFPHCTWEQSAWPLVLPSLLPSTHLVRFSWHDYWIPSPVDCEACITAMCVAATRPVRVQFEYVRHVALPEGWQERVRGAMAAAGHQYVTLLEEICMGGAM